MRRSDKIILEKILDAIDVAVKNFGEITPEDFLNNDIMKLAMAMSVIRIGELVKTLSSEFRNENKQVAWREIAGFRDIAAHKYDTLDMKELYGTIKKDFPTLKLQIKKILEHEKEII